MHTDSNSRKSFDLKPFIESMTSFLSRLSREEMTACILDYARKLPANRREAFLEAMENSYAAIAGSRDEPDPPTALLDGIADLKKAILERREGIESGAIYIEPDFLDNDEEYGYCSYDDEVPDLMIREFQLKLSGFFREANGLFLSGNLKAAYAVFKALFGIFTPESGMVDEQKINGTGQHHDATDPYDLNRQYDPYIPDDRSYAEFETGDYYPGSTLREERARFCRCVYELTPLQQRPKELAAAIDITRPISTTESRPYQGDLPLLADVENAGSAALEELENFLPAWLHLLSSYDTDRAQVLFLEATCMREGISGTARLARLWKGRQPRAYLFWMHQLREKNEWHGVIEAGTEALRSVEYGDLRAQIARELVEAAYELEDPEGILHGKREYFFSLPDTGSLIKYLMEAERQQLLDQELSVARSFLEAHSDSQNSYRALILRILLMQGNLTRIINPAEEHGKDGFVYNGESAGAILAAVFIALSGRAAEQAAAIQLLLRRGLTRDFPYSLAMKLTRQSASGMSGQDPDEFLLQAVRRGLTTHPVPSEKERRMFLAWAEDLTRETINGIVSNQLRHSYDTAALYLCAFAEGLTLIGSSRKADEVIREFRNQRYARHSSFRKKLKEIMDQSFIRY